MNQLKVDIKSTNEINQHDVSLMYDLYAQYYDYADLETFRQDLQKKNNVILIFEESMLVGFTTIKYYTKQFQGKPIQIIYSGDTIMHHDHWGNPILSVAWLRYAGTIKGKTPHLPLYWFLIVKGHRTFRYLPVFSKAYYPNHKTQTPPYEQSLIDNLAIECFGSHYLKDKGVIHYPYRGQLKAPWVAIPEKLLKKAEIKFFYDKNPNYAQGDELVCLCELHEDNLKTYSKRLFMQGIDEILCPT